MRKISFANQKGGVGKTSAVVNLAAALGQHGKNVLVVDLDGQANATRWLGRSILTDDQMRTFWLNQKEADLQEYIVGTDYKGVYVLPAALGLGDIEPLVRQRVMQANTVLKRHLSDLLEDGFDFVLMDCPPSLGALTINALVAADEVYVPLFSTVQSLDGLFDLKDTIEEIREGLNPNLEIKGVFIAFYKHGTKLTGEVEEWVRDQFGDQFMDTHIRENVRISESYSAGRPVAYYDAECNGAKDYESLAVEVLRYGKG